MTHGSTTDAFDELAGQLPKFFWHSFIKEKQATSYNDSKLKAMESDSNRCLLQMDFAENFTCTWQDEIQSAHWKQRQVTVYTVMVYHRGQNLSYVIVSDYREHEKSAVTAFTSQIMDVIKSEMPSVEVVDVWTDGPSSQYKNKYVFALLFKLQEHHGLQIQWNYFATSHGKGPNDALGGNVKRMAHRLTMARTVIVNNAETLATAVRSCETNIHVHVMDEAAIQQKCQDIGTEVLWNGLQTFQGTITTHFLKPLDKDTIQLKFYTSADEYRNLPVRHNLQNPVAGPSAAPSVTAANQVRPQPVAGPSFIKNSKKPKSLNPTPVRKHPKIRKEPDGANSDDLCGYCGHYYGSVSDPKSTDEWIECQKCRIWVHESCGEDWGVIDDDERYTCLPCL
ncbi:uncharacterized protein LOC121391661 [Gigantopelta aegis]|uniref:uncharacterized protein LOC121391661 n=1 Tax=Gigantopelta aegis TaxID=1735272 RepID=UPI001B888022|nr:uncharacterized protein LOC121391661 [Gigantopelta aegis]